MQTHARLKTGNPPDGARAIAQPNEYARLADLKISHDQPRLPGVSTIIPKFYSNTQTIKMRPVIIGLPFAALGLARPFSLMGSMAGAAKGVQGAAKGSVEAVGNAAGTVTKGMTDTLCDISVGGVVQTSTGPMCAAVGSAAKDTMNAVGDAAQNVAKGTAQLADGTVEAAKSMAKGTADMAGEAVGAAGNMVKGSVDTVSNAAGSVMKGTTDTLCDITVGGDVNVSTSDLCKAAQSAAGNMVKGSVEAVSQAAGTAGNMAKGAADAVGEAAGTAGNMAKGAADAVGNAAGTMAKSTTDTLCDITVGGDVNVSTGSLCKAVGAAV